MTTNHLTKIFLLFMLFSFMLSYIPFANAKTVVDPWKLSTYVKSDKAPPEDLVIVLRIVTAAPEGSCWFNFINAELKPKIESLMNNVVKVKLYGGGVLGDEADTIRKMRMKQVCGIGATNMGATIMVPELCVLELPFLFDYEPELHWEGKFSQIDYVLEKIEPTFAKLTAKHGYFFGGMAESWLDFIGSAIEIKSVDDLSKTKFWLFRGDRIRPEIIDVMGFGSVLSTDLFNVAQALSTKRIDTTWVGYNASIALQWWPHIKYVTDYPIFGYESATAFLHMEGMENVIAFAGKWGDRYGINDSKNLKHNMRELLDELLLKMRFLVRSEDTKARKALLEQGFVEVPMPKEEIEKLRKKIEPLYWEFADKKYPKSLLDEILKYREEYRKLKAEGKLTEDWYEKGIIPGGDQRNEWYDF